MTQCVEIAYRASTRVNHSVARAAYRYLSALPAPVAEQACGVEEQLVLCERNRKMRRLLPLVVLTISFGAPWLELPERRADAVRLFQWLATSALIYGNLLVTVNGFQPTHALAIPARPTCFVITGQLVGMQRIGLDVDLADIRREFIK